ncbi:hypothetical protein [Streptomyces mirabilis]|uniref:hypothetical protein n=1 Tax=Streptomyces mirabilis TaxID=68239 RepID=UPI0033D2ADB0
MTETTPLAHALLSALPSAPASAEDIQLLERLTLDTEPYMKDDARQYLYGLYQRMGAAEVLAGESGPVAPLLQEDLDRLHEVVECLRSGSGRSVPYSAALAEKGHLLLRRLHIGLGRSRALHWVGNLPVYEPERALAPASPS